MLASLVAQWQRICLPMQEIRVRTLGQKDSLEKKMATHSSIPFFFFCQFIQLEDNYFTT